MDTVIKAKKNLYNKGKCFTKGKLYRINKTVRVAASLMDAQTINDLGEHHIIGNWWRDFEIVGQASKYAAI
jgi:hypothetical protein